MTGKHRAGESNTSSECNSSPRRAAVDTGSEEPGIPPQSPAISAGSPGASQGEAQMEEEIFSFGTSMDSFLRSNANFTSTEQESALLHHQDVGVEDDEKRNYYDYSTSSCSQGVRES